MQDVRTFTILAKTTKKQHSTVRINVPSNSSTQVLLYMHAYGHRRIQNTKKIRELLEVLNLLLKC
jgi:hypothetical protein